MTGSARTFAFRVDASTRIGTGHVHRCLALAAALARRGVTAHFIHRLHHGHMADVIRSRGHVVHELAAPAPAATIADADYRAWAGVSEADDADATLAVLGTIAADILVVDHYGFGAAWESRVRGAVSRLVAIDDLANRRHDCDMLLDQNHFDDAAARYDGLVPDGCTRLCGPRFALLAPEYAAARPAARPRRGALDRLLVFYGGSDPANLTLLALRVLGAAEFRQLHVDVVVGRDYPGLHELQALASARGLTTIHQGLPSLLPLMLAADLAIGAGGVTSWERCCVGLPAVVTAIARNQVEPARALAAAGACLLVGTLDDDREPQSRLADALGAALRRLRADPRRLASMSERGWELGEGRGAAIVAECLFPSDPDSLRLRGARDDDCRLYWRWTNDPAVRAASLDPRPVDWTAHRDWFTRRLQSHESVLWVLETPDAVPVGQFRVDVLDGRGRVAYSIDPLFRGRGLGSSLVRAATEAWMQQQPAIPLTAQVQHANVASARVFQASPLFEQVAPSSANPRVGYEFALRHRSPASVGVA